MRVVRLACLLAVAVALLTASAAARNPWHLRCPSMPREERVPPAARPAVHAFFPWDRRGGENALRAGPVYLLVVCGLVFTAVLIWAEGLLAFDPAPPPQAPQGPYPPASAVIAAYLPNEAGNDLHRALVAVAPSYPKRITLTGRRLGRPGPHTTLAFSTNGASQCTVRSVVVSCRPRLYREARALRLPTGRRWRIVKTMLVIPRTGCFRVVAGGPGLRATIPLAVPGPDWR